MVCDTRGPEGPRERALFMQTRSYITYTDSFLHVAAPPRDGAARCHGRTADALAQEADEGRGKPR